MSEQTHNPPDPSQPLRPVAPADPHRPPTIPAEDWAQIMAEEREYLAQNFQSREQVIAWLEARGYKDSQKILASLRAGGEI
jgi:hypothetical protein